ncbi:fap1 adhesin-like [Littorina saxatilis]|uniref:Tudor domain-containing protein n=1 Tax=Littorina saxatilis TaxID=31220 RepID=A0AAN9G9M2_9CAEN
MSRRKDYQFMALEPGTTEDVFVGHITDPDNFFVQLSRTADCLEEIMNLLTTYYKDSPPEACNWQLGDTCAALYTDGEWYRGRVTGTPHNGDRLEVSFVDYGNKDYIERENIRSLRPDLFNYPVQSIHCCLEGISSAENFWSPEHVAKFEDLCLEKDFAATVVSYDEGQDVYIVQLVSEDGSNVNQKFGEMTGSGIIQAGLGAAKRSVRATDSLDLKVTVGGNAQAKPTRGIAQSLGVNINGGATSQSTIPHVSLKVGEKGDVTVVFVSTPSEFWCQVNKFAQASGQLAEQMAVTYNRMGPGEGILHNLRPGSMCAALCDADKTWYRAVIQEVTGPEATVFFIDFGNNDTVSVGNVKELKEEFRSLPAQAVSCALSGVRPSSGQWSEDASAKFEDVVMENEYTATVIEKVKNGRHIISLTNTSDNSDVATSFLGTCSEAVKVTGQTPGAAVAANMPKFPPPNIQTPSKAKVFVSWLESPSEFYIQLSDNQSVLDSLTDGLQEFYESQKATPATNVRPGSIVVSRFSDDGAWYRGVVKNITGPTSEIFFVDFGNCDKVPTVSLQQVEKQFCKIPAQAVHCSLHGIRPLSQGNTWSGDAKDFLESLTQDGATCKFLTCKAGVYEVELESSGKNVAREMIAHAVVRGTQQEEASSAPKYQHVQVARGKNHAVYVGYIDSVENFCVQLAAGMPELDQLMEEIGDYYNSGKGKPLTNPQVGMPCVAKYEEDDQWYRAQVRSFSSKDIDVFFVDYGNIQSSPRNTVFQMEPKFMNSLPAQAVQCRLSIDQAFNSEGQLDKFSTVTGNDEFEMVVKGREGAKLIVDLLKAGASVTNELKGGASPAKESPEKASSGYTSGKVSPGQTVSAFASFIESPSRFWVQLAGCDDELMSIMETLSKHYGPGNDAALANPTPGQPCVALYEEDKKWYRASVMSVHGTQVKVQFVDYGNSELVDRQNVKPISSSFLSSPLLAIECCLDGFQSSPASDDAVALLEDLVTELELSVTFKDPKNVTVFAGNKDVGQVLKDKGLGPRSQRSTPRTSPMKPPSGSNPRSPPSQPSFGGRPVMSASSPPGSSAPQKFIEATPPSGSADAIITHLDTQTGTFWVQLASSESQLQQLASQLQSTYGSGGPALRGSAAEAMACCAKFSADGCWYRSIVQSIMGPKVKVQFVDYGNSDVIPANTLKSITPDLLQAPKQVFECKLKGLQSWNAQTASVFSKTAMDDRISVRFVTCSPPYQIQASVKRQDLLQLLLSPSPSPQKGFGGGGGGGGFGGGSGASKPFDRPQQQKNSPPSKFGSAPPPRSFNDRPQRGFGNSAKEDSWGDAPPKDQPFKRNISSDSGFATTPSPPKLPEQVFQPQQCPGGSQAVYVSHVADDGTFYLQLLRDIDAIDELTTKVESAPAAAHPNPEVGAACGAKFSEDGAWYRGLVKSVAGSMADILFVDFGNGEKSDVKGLKPLPAHLLTPALAYQCQVEETGPLTPEQQETFKTASEDKEYQVTFKSGLPFSVIVKDENGTNLAETVFKPTSIRPPTAPKEMVPATVSKVDDNGRFYLQLSSQEDALFTLSDEVQTVCDGQLEKLTSFEEGQVCCAKFSEDEAWYRATVVKDNGDTVTVLFVDFGNKDTVSKDDVVVIPPFLMTKAAFAYDSKLQGVKKWKEDQKKKFEAMTEGKVMNARFMSFTPPFEVELTRSIGLELMEDEESVEEEVEEEFTDAKEVPEESAAPESQAKPEDNTEEAEMEPQVAPESQAKPEDKTSEGEIEPQAEAVKEAQAESENKGDSETETSSAESKSEFRPQTPPALDACIISHVDSDGIFYLQLTSEDDTREALSEKLQDECESPESKVVPPSVGLACCGKFSEDEGWYRAVVEKVDGDSVKVRFVDFGNTDTIPVSDLREISAESLSSAPLAYKCVLEDSDGDVVSSKLEELIADQTLTVTFESTETPPYTVNLQLENGSNVSVLLTSPSAGENASAIADQTQDSEEAALHMDRQSMTLPQGHRVKVTISHVDSPSSFCVQRDKVSQLDELSEAMLEHYSSLAEGDGLIENLFVGQLCASLFGEEEEKAWYRAQVRSIDEDTDTCKLFYVDYGNTDSVPRSSVRELLPKFKELPWQCVSCSLAGVRCSADEWSEEVKTAFEDMAAGKSVLADVLSGDGISQPYLVHALDLGIPLAETFLALNLEGVEATETPKLDNVQHIFSDTKTEESLASDLQELELDDTAQEKEDVENSEKETVDDIGETEQEFSRHLKECTAQIESTMLEDAVSRQQNVNSTQLEESTVEESAVATGEGTQEEEEEGEEEEEEEDFEDAVGAEDEGAEDDGNITETADDHQACCGCVSDGLAELEWMDIHICVAVSASEFWCQLPYARSILSGSTLGIEKARATEVVTDPKVGHLYLVCDPPLTNYRGKVLTTDCDDAKVKVLKIDYGTEENVPKGCLFPLPKHQLELPAQAFCCCLDKQETVVAKKDWLNDVITKGEAVDRDFQVKVVGRKADGIVLVDIREKSSKECSPQPFDITSIEADGDASKLGGGEEVSMDALEISQPVLESTVLGDTLFQSCMERSDGDQDYIVQPLDQGKEYHVSVSPAGRPDSFYVVQVSSKGLLDTLADDIEAEVIEKEEADEASEQLTVGSPCLVLNKTTSKWVRGQVKSSGDEYKVLCVDSGCVVDVGKESVRELPLRLLDTPAQAVLCCLADVVPVEEQWCDSALSFFTDFISNSPLKLTMSDLSPDREKYKVTLSDELSESGGDLTTNQMGNEPSVNRTLVELGYAEAVSGSPLDVELQVERTINDPDQVDQMESSFSEVVCQRENSLGENSAAEDDDTEQERDEMDASGDATKALQTESEEGQALQSQSETNGEDVIGSSRTRGIVAPDTEENGLTDESANITILQPSNDVTNEETFDAMENLDSVESGATGNEEAEGGERNAKNGEKDIEGGKEKRGDGAESGDEEYFDVDSVLQNVDVGASVCCNHVKPKTYSEIVSDFVDSLKLNVAVSGVADSSDFLVESNASTKVVGDLDDKDASIVDAGDGNNIIREELADEEELGVDLEGHVEEEAKDDSLEERAGLVEPAGEHVELATDFSSKNAVESVEKIAEEDDEYEQVENGREMMDSEQHDFGEEEEEKDNLSQAMGEQETRFTGKKNEQQVQSSMELGEVMKNGSEDEQTLDFQEKKMDEMFENQHPDDPTKSTGILTANTESAQPTTADDHESGKNMNQESEMFRACSISHTEEVDQHSSFSEKDASEFPLPCSSDEGLDGSFRLEKHDAAKFLSALSVPLPPSPLSVPRPLSPWSVPLPPSPLCVPRPLSPWSVPLPPSPLTVPISEDFETEPAGTSSPRLSLSSEALSLEKHDAAKFLSALSVPLPLSPLSVPLPISDDFETEPAGTSSPRLSPCSEAFSLEKHDAANFLSALSVPLPPSPLTVPISDDFETEPAGTSSPRLPPGSEAFSLEGSGEAEVQKSGDGVAESTEEDDELEATEEGIGLEGTVESQPCSKLGTEADNDEEEDTDKQAKDSDALSTSTSDLVDEAEDVGEEEDTDKQAKASEALSTSTSDLVDEAEDVGEEEDGDKQAKASEALSTSTSDLVDEAEDVGEEEDGDKQAKASEALSTSTSDLVDEAEDVGEEEDTDKQAKASDALSTSTSDLVDEAEDVGEEEDGDKQAKASEALSTSTSDLVDEAEDVGEEEDGDKQAKASEALSTSTSDLVDEAEDVGEDADQQAGDSESLSASASGDLLDTQLTAEDVEKVAAQLESMAVLELRHLEVEEAEEYREELAQIISEYGDSIEPDETASDKTLPSNGDEVAVDEVLSSMGCEITPAESITSTGNETASDKTHPCNSEEATVEKILCSTGSGLTPDKSFASSGDKMESNTTLSRPADEKEKAEAIAEADISEEDAEKPPQMVLSKVEEHSQRTAE